MRNHATSVKAETPVIHFLPDNNSVQVPRGQQLLHGALEAGIPLAHSCGGQGRCSTCRVVVIKGLAGCPKRKGKEETLAKQLGFPPEIRLACQLKVRTSMTVRRLVLDDEDKALVREALKDHAPIRSYSVGRERSAAILFADLRGFTAFAERLPAHDVMYVLNLVFRRWSSAIGSFGGRVDAYMGDGLLAVFEHDREKDAAVQAVRSAVKMKAEFDKLVGRIKSHFGRSLCMGIGVHCGHVIFGSVGGCSDHRITVIGDVVNIASRIEASNKTYSTSILVSEAVRKHCGNKLQLGKTVRARFPGRSGLHRLYEVAGLKST
ncbi:MAG: adenylate/guanylate cyclase domain-containing protein [Planctomycetota bacterium]